MDPVRFVTDDGVHLEGEIRLPDGVAVATAILCHPHPQHGGSKDHPILWAIRNELAHRGYAVLGFNFRGVMGSGGTYGGGRDELADARAALGRIREEAPGVPTVVVGWSFGASVALREALDDDRAAALALLGIPLRPGDLELPSLPGPTERRAFTRPVLLLTGDGDAFCPQAELRAFAVGFPRADVEILEGTDHFMWRREREASAIVGAFADRSLGIA